jgi:predicted AlkP superfamily pyrophosphatase or phosphodiesterase
VGIARRALLALALLGPVAARAQAPVPDLAPTLILVGLDGWRWDYAQRHPAPNVRRLAARGVSAPLVPSFPSKTFPNHYTIVTGLYPGHHGIVANSVHDPPSGRRLTMADRDEVRDAMWWGGEPLWVTAERSGRRTAPVFWPGSEAPILGVRPRYSQPYDHEMPGEERVDRLLALLDLSAGERPVFATLYFSDVDSAGHASGPRSQAVADAVARVDGYLGRLLAGLAKRGLAERVNLVLVSDHGMAESDLDHVVVLEERVSEMLDVVDLNPTLAAFPRPGREAEAHATLLRLHPRLRVYWREESPPHWRFREHPRVPPLVGVADEGWQVMRRSSLEALRAAGPRRVGVHGYDPLHAPSMRGLLVAAGPAFREGRTLPPLENVHLYGALVAALGLTPAANDGDPKLARSLLRATR